METWEAAFGADVPASLFADDWITVLAAPDALAGEVDHFGFGTRCGESSWRSKREGGYFWPFATKGARDVEGDGDELRWVDIP